MKPFLKWAGGKFRIVERIKTVLPSGKRLVEPFVGSGALFLNSDYPENLLADINGDLISLYQIVQEQGVSFIDYCEPLFSAANNSAAAYYSFRQEFNHTIDLKRKAALFLYLNKHGYNGLCRYNASGGFNVPFGKFKKPYFPRREMRFFHQKAQAATFVCADFQKLMNSLNVGDVVYCDPPYVPLSATANFTSYSAQQFGLTQQSALAKMAVALAARGIPVLISNHDTPFTRHEYQAATLTSFTVQRHISRNGAQRRKATELLAVFR